MITNIKKTQIMKTLKAIRHILTIVCLLAFPALLTAQDRGRIIQTDDFTAIKAGSIYNIQLIQGDTHHVEVFGDDNILKKTEISVRNGVLSLEYSGTTRNQRIEVTVISPLINRIDLSGAAALASQNGLESTHMEIELSGASSANVHVRTSHLKTRISGAANLTISGEAESLNAGVSGASQLRAQNLQTQTASVNASGASFARINVSEHLKADASGTARITFDNEPASKEVTTSGVATVNEVRAGTSSSSGDTTRVRVGGRDIIIIDDEEGKIRVQKRKKSFRNNWSGFEMGINGFVNPERSLNLTGEAAMIEPRYEKSYVYNLNLIQQSIPLVSKNVGLFTGLGLTWNNYRFDNQTRIIPTRDYVEFEEEEREMIKNRLRTTWITVPLMLELQSSGRRQVEKFHVAGGVIVGARIGSSARYVYRDNGKRRSEKDHSSFNITPFRYDLAGRIGWGRINLFANYALNSLFLSDRGPELYPFSVGIRLVNF
jgi:hypothetical protein